MLKTLTQTLLAAFCAILLAAPLEGGGVMLIGMKNAMLAGGGWDYDVQDYVGWGTSDLLCCYDGIRNVDATSPHSTTATTWKDLVSGNALTKHSTASWGENCRVYTGGCEFRYISQAMANALNNQNYTIEFIVKPNSNTGADWLCMGSQYASPDVRDRIQGLVSDKTVRYLQNAPGYIIVWQASYNDDEIIHLCAMQDSPTSGRVFYNGAESIITRDYAAPIWNTTHFFVIANEPMFRNNSLYVLRGKVYAVRMYSRALTAAEVAANYAVDKARFNLA